MFGGGTVAQCWWKPPLRYTSSCLWVTQEDLLQKQVQGWFLLPCSGSFDMNCVHPSGVKKGEKGFKKSSLAPSSPVEQREGGCAGQSAFSGVAWWSLVCVSQAGTARIVSIPVGVCLGSTHGGDPLVSGWTRVPRSWLSSARFRFCVLGKTVVLFCL